MKGLRASPLQSDDRVVGHSSFLDVLNSEVATRVELLKLLVLLASAGGVMAIGDRGVGSAGPSSEVPAAADHASAAARAVGSALVGPLLAVYRASLSEEDQVCVAAIVGHRSSLAMIR